MLFEDIVCYCEVVRERGEGGMVETTALFSLLQLFSEVRPGTTQSGNSLVAEKYLEYKLKYLILFIKGAVSCLNQSRGNYLIFTALN